MIFLINLYDYFYFAQHVYCVSFTDEKFLIKKFDEIKEIPLNEIY